MSIGSNCVTMKIKRTKKNDATELKLHTGKRVNTQK